jgi:hypothetical protein
VSDSLDQKSGKIGSAKDRALDLHRRANNLANSASSKLANLLDMEKEYEENQRQLDSLSSQLTQLNCKMQIHLMVKLYYYKGLNYYFLLAFDLPFTFCLWSESLILGQAIQSVETRILPSFQNYPI